MAATLELLIDPSGAESGAKRAASAADQLVASTDKAAQGFDVLQESMAKIPAAASSLGGSVRPVDELAASYGRLGGNVQELEDVQAKLASALERSEQAIEQAASTLDASAASSGSLTRELHDLSGAYGVTREEATDLEGIQSELADSLRNAAEAAETQREVMERVGKATAEQQTELYNLEGAYRRTADQADTLEDVHLRLALALERDKIAASGLADESAKLAVSSDRAGGSIEQVGSHSISASKSIGKAVDAALGLENVFGKIITRGVYFLGADLVARAFGFQGALDLIGKSLDAVGKGIQDAGEGLLNYLAPGFAESAKAAEDLEKRLGKIAEKREALTRERFTQIAGQKIDLEPIFKDEKLREQFDEAQGRATELLEQFARLRSAATADPRTGAVDAAAVKALQEGIRATDFATEARLRAAGASDDLISKTTGLVRVYRDETEVVEQLLGFNEQLKKQNEDLAVQERNRDIVESRGKRETAISPEAVEKYDSTKFEEFNDRIVEGLQRREDRELALADAIRAQEMADDDALEAARHYSEQLDILQTFYGEAEDAARSYDKVLEEQRNLTRIEGLSTRDAHERELDLIEARNVLIEAGVEPSEKLVRTVAHELELRRQIAETRTAREEVGGVLESLEAEIKALDEVGAAREHASDLRRLEALAAADQTGEIEKLLEKYKEELKLLDVRSKARAISDREKQDAEEYGKANARAAAMSAESWVLGAKTAKEAWQDFARELLALAVRRYFTMPLFNLLAPTASAKGDTFVGGRLTQMAYGGEIDAVMSRHHASMRNPHVEDYVGGRLTQMAYGGEVVTSPTVFNGPDSSHMIGEGGPEVVAPVARDAKGNVGVRLLDGGASNQTFVFNVSTPNPRAFGYSQRQLSENARRLYGQR